MTVKTFLDNRNNSTYGKSIRILDNETKKNCGNCLHNFDAIVISIKITKKYLFIFVKKY